MCWIGKGPARIAERDIVVYKLGYVIETTKEFRSLYQNYTYYFYIHSLLEFLLSLFHNTHNYEVI